MNQLQYPEELYKKFKSLKTFHPICLDTAIKRDCKTAIRTPCNQFPKEKNNSYESLEKQWKVGTRKISISNWKDLQSLQLIIFQRENPLQLKQLFDKIADDMENATHLSFNFKSYNSINPIGLELLTNIMSNSFLKLQNLSLTFKLYGSLKIHQIQKPIKKIVANLPKLNHFDLCLKKDNETEGKDFIKFVLKTYKFLSGISKLKNYSFSFNKFERITLKDIQEISHQLLKTIDQNPSDQNFSISFRRFPMIDTEGIESFLKSIYKEIPSFPPVPSSSSERKNEAFGQFHPHNDEKTPFKVLFTQDYTNLQPDFIGLTLDFQNGKEVKILREYQMNQTHLNKYFNTETPRRYPSYSNRKERIKIYQSLDVYQDNKNQFFYQHNLSISLNECNEINDEHLQQLGYDISVYSPYIKSLSFQLQDIKIKNLSDVGLEYFIFGICKNQALSLQSLTLKFDDFSIFTDKGLQVLARQICENLKNLQYLSLSFQKCTSITQEGMSSLIHEIWQHLVKLKSLSLDFRHINRFLMPGKDFIAQYLKETLPDLVNLQLLF